VDVATTQDSQVKVAPVEYQTEPAKYKHWRVAYDGSVATLTMDVNEDGGLRPGYKLKLNSVRGRTFICWGFPHTRGK
jgi:benzoyl-CoA-dihydrodiol lyase